MTKLFKTLSLTLLLAGTMSCAHKHGHHHDHGKKDCSAKSCDMKKGKDAKACCGDKKEAKKS